MPHVSDRRALTTVAAVEIARNDIHISLRGRSIRSSSGGDRETVRDSLFPNLDVDVLCVLGLFMDGSGFGSSSCRDNGHLISSCRWRLLDQWRSPINAMANQTLLFFTEACIRCWDVDSALKVFEEMPIPDVCAGAD
ncbi:hypothetical protein OPV22_011432 [Ensete ventricosum]|uniref:Pentatricopeptide repeat-containing protein n=1 Tax=Ensete ventricosum TaxID=4639 RepID=A0AAV8RFN8_ENSVE|nr:hypothetical protein OPV22_011432 [Ensete ventricosum]